jgi:prepilin-type N-terminal cleavage/methylation domain-containing protein
MGLGGHPRAIQRRLGAEAGFTLVEVLVAVMIIALGITSALTVFDVSTRATFNAERSQVAVDEAQRQMEDMRALDYDQVALSSTPATTTDPNDPTSRVNGTRFELTDGDTSSFADLVVNGQSGITNGAIAPGPSSFSEDGITGKVYRFVVWQDDPGCTTTCPGTQDFKRVIVAVKLDSVGAATGGRRYVELQSDFTPPKEGVQGSAPPPSNGQTVTAEQLFLTDTSCDHTTRQAIAGDHLDHNTLAGVAGIGLLASCDRGLHTGSTAGAPDLLAADAPTDPDPSDPTNPPYYDYATDIEPVLNPQNDKGLQLRRPAAADGCVYDPAPGGEANPQEVVHRWVSTPMAANFVATGKATLNFWTRTLNQTNQPGKLCIWLFTRNSLGSDTLISSLDTSQPYFTFQLDSWPHSSAWAQESVQMNFSQVTVQSGSRIGVAVGVERAGTQGAIEFLYDHPEGPSRLEVATNTPIG